MAKTPGPWSPITHRPRRERSLLASFQDANRLQSTTGGLRYAAIPGYLLPTLPGWLGRRKRLRGNGLVTQTPWQWGRGGVSNVPVFPGGEFRRVSFPRAEKRRNTPHSKRFAEEGCASEVAKRLECAVCPRFWTCPQPVARKRDELSHKDSTSQGRGALAPSLSDKLAWRRSAGFQSARATMSTRYGNSRGSARVGALQAGGLRYSRPEVCATSEGQRLSL
jgi:hypothetical protein